MLLYEYLLKQQIAGCRVEIWSRTLQTNPLTKFCYMEFDMTQLALYKSLDWKVGQFGFTR